MISKFQPTIILRHRKENLKKCSLRGLEAREDLQFFTYPTSKLPDLSGYILLAVDAPPLSKEDADSGLFLIDGTWRYAETMAKPYQNLKKRSLPTTIQTAYPRRQEIKEGLASVEALYAAYSILGRETEGLLDHYHWKSQFLDKLP